MQQAFHGMEHVSATKWSGIHAKSSIVRQEESPPEFFEETCFRGADNRPQFTACDRVLNPQIDPPPFRSLESFRICGYTLGPKCMKNQVQEQVFRPFCPSKQVGPQHGPFAEQSLGFVSANPKPMLHHLAPLLLPCFAASIYLPRRGTRHR